MKRKAARCMLRLLWQRASLLVLSLWSDIASVLYLHQREAPICKAAQALW